jgi:hypothetical protein
MSETPHKPNFNALQTPAGDFEGVETRLLLNETEVINYGSEGIQDPADIGMPSILDDGSVLKIIGRIDLCEDSAKSAIIIEVTSPDGVRGQHLSGLEQRDGQGDPVFNGKNISLEPGQEIALGRSMDKSDAERLWNNTEFPDTVSRNHTQIKLGIKGIEVTDSSTNGTSMKKSEASPDSVNFDNVSVHTVSAEGLARMQGKLEQKDDGVETFFGRKVINRNTTDPEGMVDIRSWVSGAESIVVDSEKDPDLNRFAEKAFAELANMNEMTEKDVLAVIYKTVAEGMEYDMEFADKMADSVKDSPHKKISLGYYMAEGKGVCRHMALAGQWLGAKVAEKYPGVVSGEFTAPVNQSNKGNGAHEWVRYTAASGEVYIIDPAQKFFGSLEDSMKKGQAGKVWEYFKDVQEKKDYAGRQAGQIAVRQGGMIKVPQNIKDYLDGHNEPPLEKTPRPVVPKDEQLATANRELNELRSEFSEDDNLNMLRYVSAMQNKREDQKRGDGAGSSIQGQQAGQAYNSMSKSAKDALSRYEQLMNKVERLYGS